MKKFNIYQILTGLTLASIAILIPFSNSKRLYLLILFSLAILFMLVTYFKNLQISSNENNLKVLDSSAIIDGRIVEIIESNFIEGILIIPSFILKEIHRLSDSDISLKRARGRRALDLIDKLVKQNKLSIKIETIDYAFTSDVDTKIITFAKERNAKILTTDYNMSKVAKIHGVHVMNINNLANVMKSILLPEEEMEIEIFKKGDKNNQGIGYLEDGTMIVVENCANRLGEKVNIIITGTYPTAAGKIIFAKPKAYEENRRKFI